MNLLFLAIDGVLNDGIPQDNGYTDIDSYCVAPLNKILQNTDVEIVVTSEWRKEFKDPKTFETLLLRNGVHCKGRIYCFTVSDKAVWRPKEDGPCVEALRVTFRERQIMRCVDRYKPDRFVVLDAKPLNVPSLVKVASEGLSTADAQRVVRILSGELP